LIVAGVLTQEQLQHGLYSQQRWGGPLGKVLVKEGLVSENVLVQALSQQLNIPLVNLRGMMIDQQVLDLIPAEVCKQFGVVGFQVQGKFLDVAMSDPMNMGVLDELRIRTQLNVRPHLATATEIIDAIKNHYAHDMDVGPTGLEFGSFVDEEQLHRRTPPPGDLPGAEIAALQRRVAALESLVTRDENVIRKLMGLLVSKGVATREELLEAIRS
jgi:hypothetical protein